MPAAEAVPAPRVHREASVHPTAILEGDVEIGAGTRVGPGCLVLGTVGPVRIGTGCTLIANATVNGPITVGDGNVLYPQVCLGFAPQDIGFDPNTPGPGCVVGNRNTFREGATVHRGKTSEPTRIGDSNYWMTNTHLGHDGVVGNGCIIGSGAVLGGHVIVDDKVIIGGCAAIHQFARLGHHSFVSGLAGTIKDLLPWFVCTAVNVAGSINVVGLRRSGADASTIAAVRWVYRTLYRTGCTPQQALAELETRASDPVVAEYVAFIRSSKRGICHGAGRSTRGLVARPGKGEAAAEGLG
jgi:UDP-N-acetylglucosamine acyltransferase